MANMLADGVGTVGAVQVLVGRVQVDHSAASLQGDQTPLDNRRRSGSGRRIVFVPLIARDGHHG